MRFYPTKDVNFYWDMPYPWAEKGAWFQPEPKTPRTKRELPDVNFPKKCERTVQVWRPFNTGKVEINYASKSFIDCCLIPIWHCKNRRTGAKLPVQRGPRFIKVDKTGPFYLIRCPLPKPMRFVRRDIAIQKRKIKQERKQQREQRIEADLIARGKCRKLIKVENILSKLGKVQLEKCLRKGCLCNPLFHAIKRAIPPRYCNVTRK